MSTTRATRSPLSSECRRLRDLYLPNHWHESVTELTLSTCSAFDEDRRRNIEITPWDREFYNVDQSEIFDIVLAANYLDIKQLL